MSRGRQAKFSSGPCDDNRHDDDGTAAVCTRQGCFEEHGPHHALIWHAKKIDKNANYKFRVNRFHIT